MTLMTGETTTQQGMKLKGEREAAENLLRSQTKGTARTRRQKRMLLWGRSLFKTFEGGL